MLTAGEQVAPPREPRLGHPGSHCFAGLLGQLEAHRLAGLLLDYARPRQDMAPVGNVLNLQTHQITGPEHAVDGEVEEGQLTCLPGQLQAGALGPDLLELQG